MKNPYAQVALTYLRRPFSSVWTFLMVGLFVAIMLFPLFGNLLVFRSGHGTERMWIGDQQSATSPLLMLFLSSTGILFGLAVIHIKEQFANPQRT